MPQTNNKNRIISAIVVLVLVIVFLVTKQKSDTAPTTSTPVDTGTSTDTTLNNNRKYKDGTFSSAGVYNSPAGSETVDVTLTLKDGIITDSTFQANSGNPISKKLQNNFKDGYEAVVIGKSIDSLSLTVVNGSSLTPKGFMDAVNKIKVQAQA